MPELMNEIQALLDEALLPLGIHSSPDEREDGFGNEYVVYSFISSRYTEYANNLPIAQRCNVDVAYYASKRHFNFNRLALIEKAFRSAGWLVFNPAIAVPCLKRDTTMAVIEFCKEQVI